MRLARSIACENQAFQIGKKVMGLQFHLEMTPDSVGAIIRHCRKALVPGAFVQTEKVMRTADAAIYVCTNGLMEQVLNYMALYEDAGEP